MKTVQGIVTFVKDFPDPKNLDAIGNVVFRNSSCDLEEAITKLKNSVAYFRKKFEDKSKLGSPGNFFCWLQVFVLYIYATLLNVCYTVKKSPLIVRLLISANFLSCY